MYKKMALILKLSVIIIGLYHNNANAFWLKTHEKITTNAIGSANLNSMVKDQTGLENPLQISVTISNDMKTLKQWIEFGSQQEDEPLSELRYLNHFYNPITNSGLADFPFYGKSSYEWANDTQNNLYSWNMARYYYHLALVASSDASRKEALAKSFRAIGQIMHLVQDLASVAHVRNDAHPFGDGFERYAAEHIKSLDFSKIISSTLTNSVSPYAPRQFWDFDTYDGTNPSESLHSGLAEYTNANFFSGDTIFSSSFPYPAWSSVEEYEEVVNETTGEKRTYLRKTGDGETVEHLATPRLLMGYKLDDRCYKDYAQKLIPRAVGYSAGLLNYFFRGDIDLLEDTSSGSGYIIVNNTEEDMEGTFGIYYDKASYDGRGSMVAERTLIWHDTLTIGKRDPENPGNNKSQNIQLIEPADAIKPGRYILVFSGRLGSEENAVVGKVTHTPTDPYIMIMPVNHETREILPKKYYFYKVKTNTFSSVSDLPFSLLDDGGYWDSTSRTWTRKTDRESLGVPLGTGGPQYIAKHWDEENQRVRYISNLSYEKEAYNAFNATPSDSNGTIKDITYLTYVGSPLLSAGMYNENTGWMEYTDSGLYSILAPSADVSQRFFISYRSGNFDDRFVQVSSLKSYNFDGSTSEVAIPADGDAPLISTYSDLHIPSIIGAYRPEGVEYVNVSVPRIYNTYQKPNAYGWKTDNHIGSSGVDHYMLYPDTGVITPSIYVKSEYKCVVEDKYCGVMDGRTVNTVFNIPYNFNSFITVHQKDNGQYYEEVYVNGSLVDSSSPAPTFETHYQILAVYKNTAVVRETKYIESSYTETPLQYQLKRPFFDDRCIYEKQWRFKSRYYIYVNNVRYGPIGGETGITMKYLDTPYKEECAGNPSIDYLTGTYVDDIIGYHPDRIFISDTFDGSYILVAFDEYAYNNGEGLTHDLKYEPSDSDPTKHILYYDIPKTEIQNADHEATRTGRKLLLFKSDGTLKQELQDPVGLDKTIGSIGILN